jgi:O-antigen/teichoic acid export membrane protein
MHREILVINVSALAASTLLMCVLVPLDGAHGAAIGIAIGEVAAAILSGAILIARHPGLRPSFGVVPRTALAAAVGVIPLALPVPVIVRLLLSTALFGAAIVATRALPPELRALLPGSA